MLLNIAILVANLCNLIAANINDVRFPATWTGDKFVSTKCNTTGQIPEYISGYFLGQVAASYGEQSNPSGQKLTHMIDAIGGLAAYNIINGKVYFTGAYYPSAPYRIWDFYERDFSKSQVSWSSWSDFNRTKAEHWQQLGAPSAAVPWHPNRAFWLIGSTLIAVGHAPLWIGLKFKAPAITEFANVDLLEDDLAQAYNNGKGDIHPLLMAANAVNDEFGNIWSVSLAVDTKQHRSFVLVFSIDRQGRRKIRGELELGQYDPDKECSRDDDEYYGDKRNLASYIRSVSVAGNRFLVMPMSSLAVNPCKFKFPPSNPIQPGIEKGGVWGLDYYHDLPVRFLVFDITTREFVTPKPLETDHHGFITHTINAHQKHLGLIMVDVIEYPSAQNFLHKMYVDKIIVADEKSDKNSHFGGMPLRYGLRLSLNRAANAVMTEAIQSVASTTVDFPTINPVISRDAYNWFYVVERVFQPGSLLIKANVRRLMRTVYQVDKDTAIVANPLFVPKQLVGAQEDEGTLLVRTLNMVTGKGELLFLNAEDMSVIARSTAPTNVPLGLHNAFFTHEQLDTDPMEPITLPSAPTELPETSRQTSKGSYFIFTDAPTTQRPTTTTTTVRPTTRRPTTHRPTTQRPTTTYRPTTRSPTTWRPSRTTTSSPKNWWWYTTRKPASVDWWSETSRSTADPWSSKTWIPRTQWPTPSTRRPFWENFIGSLIPQPGDWRPANPNNRPKTNPFWPNLFTSDSKAPFPGEASPSLATTTVFVTSRPDYYGGGHGEEWPRFILTTPARSRSTEASKASPWVPPSEGPDTDGPGLPNGSRESQQNVDKFYGRSTLALCEWFPSLFAGIDGMC